MGRELTIAIDARWIFEKLSGVGVYARNLIRNLALLEEEIRYILLFDDEALMARELHETGTNDRDNVSAELLSYSVFSFRSQVKLSRRLKRLGVDVLHSPNFMIPLGRSDAKRIVTIHDLIPLLFPQYTGRSKKTRFFPLYKRIMKKVARRADAILADSDCTRDDIMRELKASPDKVHTVHLGVDEMFSPGPATGLIRKKFGISGKLLLCVGRQDPYKNLIAAVKAFQLVMEKNRGLDCQMLIVGEKDPRYPEVAEYVAQMKLSARIVMTDYLSDEELVAAYREADLLVHLSLYEGFGLPPLEAMACGTPVVSSDRASLPEVLGDAALFTNPDDPSETAKKITMVLTDDQLRNQLISNGRHQAAKYTWNATASRVIQIYRKVAASAAPPIA